MEFDARTCHYNIIRQRLLKYIYDVCIHYNKDLSLVNPDGEY